MQSAKETDLIQLQADKTGDERSRCRDGGDDLTRNLLRRMPVCRCDAVVHRAEVRRSGDEVDMVVRIIVLLEFDRVEAVTDKRRR